MRLYILSDFDEPTECGRRQRLETQQGWQKSSGGVLGRQAPLEEAARWAETSGDTGQNVRGVFWYGALCCNEQRLSHYRSDLL